MARRLLYIQVIFDLFSHGAEARKKGPGRVFALDTAASHSFITIGAIIVRGVHVGVAAGVLDSKERG